MSRARKAAVAQSDLPFAGRAKAIEHAAEPAWMEDAECARRVRTGELISMSSLDGIPRVDLKIVEQLRARLARPSKKGDRHGRV